MGAEEQQALASPELKGKVALVTGASRGIGQATAIELARRGARVVVHCHQNLAAAETTCSVLPGGSHLVLQADMRSPEAVGELIETAHSRMGSLDILVNNAGIFRPAPVLEITYAD